MVARTRMGIQRRTRVYPKTLMVVAWSARGDYLQTADDIAPKAAVAIAAAWVLVDDLGAVP